MSATTIPVSAWEMLPFRMPKPDYCTASTINLVSDSSGQREKILVVGERSVCHIFDPYTQTWTPVPSINLHSFGCASVCRDGNTVFLAGGWDDTWGDVKRITLNDESLDRCEWQWTISTRIPHKNCAMVLLQDNILVIMGGSDRTTGVSSILREVNWFDLREENERTWMMASLPDMSHPRESCAAVSYQNKIYVFGGHNGRRVIDTVEIFDLSSRTWESLAERMPRGRCKGTAIVMSHSFVLLIGGFDENYKLLNEVDCFDMSMGQWIPGLVPPLNMARLRSGVASVNKNEIYVFGGEGQQHYSRLDTMEKITLDPYHMILPRLLPLLHQNDLPLGLWPYIVAACPPNVIHFILCSKKFGLDSVLLHPTEQIKPTRSKKRKVSVQEAKTD